MQTQTKPETDIATEIRQWRADIATMKHGSAMHTAMLAYSWNWATSPTALRTDREHRACRRFARRAYRALRQRTGWHHMESGLIWVDGLNREER